MKKKTLKKMFNYINDELFDSELDMPYLLPLSTDQCKLLYPLPIDGIYTRDEYDNHFIGIHEDLTATQAFDTMVHEMIHQYLVKKKEYDGHGKPFLKLCEKAIDTFYWRML